VDFGQSGGFSHDFLNYCFPHDGTFLCGKKMPDLRSGVLLLSARITPA
jgi:hypothetical protein